WIERPRLDLQQILGPGPNRLSDGQTVLRSPLQGLKDEHIERPLKDVDPIFAFFDGHRYRHSITKCIERLYLCAPWKDRPALTVSRIDWLACRYLSAYRALSCWARPCNCFANASLA